MKADPFLAIRLDNENVLKIKSISDNLEILLFRDDRANVAVIQSLAWTVGLCILPFIYWIVGDWLSFFVITSVPMLLFLFIPT